MPDFSCPQGVREWKTYVLSEVAGSPPQSCNLQLYCVFFAAVKLCVMGLPILNIFANIRCCGHQVTLFTLQELKADPNVRSMQPIGRAAEVLMCPLHLAIAHGNHACVSVLLKDTGVSSRCILGVRTSHEREWCLHAAPCAVPASR